MKGGMSHIVDFSAFDNIQSGDHCDGNHPQNCKCLDRVIAALDYHQFLVVNPLNEKYGDDPKAAFVSFCDELYPKTAMLNDYIHFTEHHTDPATIEYIQGRLVMKCESAQKCGATSRHYRDRGDGVSGGDGLESLWCIDRMDSIHFTVHHLTELGLRVKASDLESALTADEQEVEDSESVDVALQRLAEIIKAKRAMFSNERLDGTTNSKFTLHVDEMKESGDETGSDGMSFGFYFHSVCSQRDSECFHSFDDLITTKTAKGKDTKRDVVLQLIWDKLTDKLLWSTLQRVVVEQDMDSDCIEADVEEEDDSNLYRVLEGNDEIMDALRVMLRHSKIMEKSFATGHPLFYWKWHRNATKEMVKGDPWLSSFMDLGGRSVQELSVDPRYDSIKEEVLATGLVSPQQFQELVVEKADQYLKSDKCKELKCKPMVNKENPLHFEFKKGDALQPRHLHAIILYCDFTKLCTLFSRSLRKNGPNDGLKEIKKNNSKFFHFTKALREIVTYFGSDSGPYPWQTMNGVVKGPFFSGVSVVLNLSEFSIGFNTPTSTTMTREIALRFASNGMVITIGNQKGMSKLQPVFSAKWISAFSEEDEYLWFGSVFKLSVENIFILESSKSYKQSIGALYLFAAALSGQRFIGRNVTLKEQQILNECIASVSGGASNVVSKAVDEYITDNMYCFCKSNTKMLLVLKYSVLHPFPLHQQVRLIFN